MKKLIRPSRSIFGMSFQRSTAKSKIQQFASIIEQHIIELVVYSECRYLSVNHWCNELATWMYAVNKIRYNNPKEKDYIQWLFDVLGDSEDDAYANLAIYRANNLRSARPYPDFEVTDELAKKLHEYCDSFIKNSMKFLLDSKVHSTSEWKQLIQNIK